MSPRHTKLAIASVGCALAVTAALVGGLQRSRVESKLQIARTDLASLSGEIARRDRLFDIANTSRGAWEQSRIALRILSAVSQQIYGPAVESIENLIVDTLNWGSEAASGSPLSGEDYAEVQKVARLIATDEARRSEKIQSPTEAERPPNERELEKAVSFVSSERRRQIDDYWKNRRKMLNQQGELSSTAAGLERSIRSIEGLVLALQIAGLLIVLLKDLVPDEEPASGTPSPSIELNV